MLERIKSLLNVNIMLNYKLKWESCTMQYLECGRIRELKEDYCNGMEITFGDNKNNIIFVPVKYILNIEIL